MIVQIKNLLLILLVLIVFNTIMNIYQSYAVYQIKKQTDSNYEYLVIDMIDKVDQSYILLKEEGYIKINKVSPVYNSCGDFNVANARVVECQELLEWIIDNCSNYDDSSQGLPVCNSPRRKTE